MARRPFSGECSVLTGEDYQRGERVFLTELASHLGIRAQELSHLARKRRLLKTTWRDPGRHKVRYLTPYGAAVMITVVRAMQGQEWLDGKAERMDQLRAYWREQIAARRRRAAQASVMNKMTVCSVLFSVENPLAGTEDESRGAQREQDEAESGETPAVSANGSS